MKNDVSYREDEKRRISALLRPVHGQYTAKCVVLHPRAVLRICIYLYYSFTIFYPYAAHVPAFCNTLLCQDYFGPLIHGSNKNSFYSILFHSLPLLLFWSASRPRRVMVSASFFPERPAIIVSLAVWKICSLRLSSRPSLTRAAVRHSLFVNIQLN